MQQRLAALAEAGGLNGGDIEDAAQLVDDQCGERLAGDVLGDDEQRPGLVGALAELHDDGASSAGSDCLAV